LDIKKYTFPRFRIPRAIRLVSDGMFLMARFYRLFGTGASLHKERIRSLQGLERSIHLLKHQAQKPQVF
jgi:hypothetical protein